MNALLFWDKIVNCQEYRDYTDRVVYRQNFNDKTSCFGWTIEKIDISGNNDDTNLQIVSLYAHLFRNKRNQFVIDNVKYEYDKKLNKIVVNAYSLQKIWVSIFGDVDKAFDFANRLILREHFNDDNEYSWNIDHILPISKGGSDDEDNIQIVNVKTNIEKSNKTAFTIDNINYIVKSHELVTKDELNNCNYSFKNSKYVVVKNTLNSFNKTNFWYHEFGESIISKDYDGVYMHKDQDDWIVEKINIDKEMTEDNLHIVSVKTHHLRNNLNKFTIEHQKIGTRISYYVTSSKLAKSNTFYDYSLKSDCIAISEVDFLEDDDNE